MGKALLWLVVIRLLGVLATVYLPGIGREMNGSHRWLEVSLPALGELSLQPSGLHAIVVR